MRERLAGLRYPTGKALVQRYRQEVSEATVLGFSRGKDSIATALAIGDDLDVYPVFCYSIPGLTFIEESLDYYSRKLFHGRKIEQYPEGAFYRWLNSGMYQTPGTAKVIEAANLVASGHAWWRQVTSWVVEDHGLSEPTLSATGLRATDSPMRFLNVKNTGVIRPSAGNWCPIWDYSKADVVAAVERSGISLPIDYLLFGRSFSGGLDARYLVPLKRHRPQDWKIVLEMFPLADVIVWKYENFVDGR